MNSRIELQLKLIGASHQAESVIALLNGATRALQQHSRDHFNEVMADAEMIAAKLVKAISDLRDENEAQRVAEYEASRRSRLLHFGHVPALRLVEREEA